MSEEIETDEVSGDSADEKADEKVYEKTDVTGDETDDAAIDGKKKSKKRKRLIIIAVIVVVLVAGVIGALIWHEQPTFCNAICHTPMDGYVESYYSGDENLLVTTHARAGKTCLNCHIPTIEQQINEGVKWVTGDYVFPLETMEYEDSFCLNEACHNLTRDDLIEKTSSMEFNPHVAQHGEIACGECHKVHDQSVLYCSQCHADAEVPEGWLTAAEAANQE